MKKWLVIGGGNGGHATAAQLAIAGESVRLYDILQRTVDLINEQGGIEAVGALEGFGQIEFATTDMALAMNDVDNIIVVAPSFAHKNIAENMAPYLRRHHKVLLHPSTMFGSLEFIKTIRDLGNDEEIVIGETMSLLYAARLVGAGKVNVLGIKDTLQLATIPADRGDEFIEAFGRIFPQLENDCRNVLEIGLRNVGCVVHPLPTLLSTSLVESEIDWHYYMDAMTPSVAKAMKAIDSERMAVGKAVGLELSSIEATYEEVYGVTGESLVEIIHNVEAYKGVKGHHNVNSRYLTEEVPYALMPMISLGKKAGIKTPAMEATVTLAELLLGKTLTAQSRTLDSVGLGEETIEDIVRFVEAGESSLVNMK